MLESPGMSHFEVKELVLLNMEGPFYMYVTVYIYIHPLAKRTEHFGF